LHTTEMDKFVVKKRKVDAEEPESENSPQQKVLKTGEEVEPVVFTPECVMAETVTDPKWRQLLAPEFAKTYYKNIEKQVAAQREKGEVYPPTAEVYAQFNHCPLDKIRVVIIGQDPYFNPGQAEGLCFSVKKGVPIPPSLNRIYKVVQKKYSIL